MKNAKEQVVLVFHSSVRSSWNEMAASIYRLARPLDWNVQIVEHAPNRSSIEELIRFWKPAGIIVEGGMDGRRLFFSDVFGSLPVVRISCDRVRLPTRTLCVDHDSKSIGQLAAREFLSLNLASFAFFGFTGIFWSDDRGRAFEAALKLNGRPVARFTRRFFEAEGRSAERGFERSFARWLLALPKPVGLLAANDLLAVEALNVCRAVGLKVPDDVSVLGIDNDEIACENALPTLSSIRPNFAAAGALAVELLAERLRAGRRFAYSSCRSFAAEGIVRRQSTRRLPRANADVARAMEMIRRRACEGLRPRDVFAEFGCSRRLAELRFRELTGHSVSDEILAVRLARVKTLLGQDDVPIDSIAERCGWKSQGLLRTIFRAAEGQSLSAWRKALRETSAT